jgi:hypothetical protein
MFTRRSSDSVSRRAALAGLGAGGLGLALTAPARSAAAESSSLADHPLTGAWLITLPGGVAPSFFGTDGTVLLACPTCEQNAAGQIIYSTSALGTWESANDRVAHVNVVQVLTDSSGGFVGTRSLRWNPYVTVDGQSFVCDGTSMRVYLRDSSNTVIAIRGEEGDLPSLSGVRMSPGSHGFPSPKGSPAEL